MKKKLSLKKLALKRETVELVGLPEVVGAGDCTTGGCTTLTLCDCCTEICTGEL